MTHQKGHLSSHIWLKAILILSFLVRILRIDSRSIIYDDAFTILLSRKSFADIVAGTAADTMPPLFYFLLHVWGMVSQNIVWLRLLPIIISVISIWLFFLIVRIVVSEQAALWSAGLAAISPILYYHAQDVRMYALAVAFLLGYLWCFITLLRHDSSKLPVRAAVGFVLCGAGALYSHNLAGFALLIPNLYLLLRQDWVKQGRLILMQILIMVLFTPWLFYLPDQLGKIQTAFWTPRPGFVEVFQAILQMTVNLPLPSGVLVIGSIFGVSAFVLSIFTCYRSNLDGDSKLLLGIWMLSTPLLIFIISYLMRPLFVTRGFLIAVYGFLAISGTAIAHAVLKPVKWGLVTLFLGASIIGLVSTITQSEFPRSQFLDVGRTLQLESNDTIIIHENKLSYFPMVYYFPDFKQVFLADQAGSPNDTLAYGTQAALGIYPVQTWREATNDEPRVTFVTFQQANDEYREMGLLENPIVREMQEEFHLVSVELISDMVIYRLRR